METVVLVVHLMLALALVGVVLLQKSEGGALGMGGGGMAGFMTGRSTANLLTRATAVLAACFMVTSVTLVILAGRGREVSSIIDQAPATQSTPQPALPPISAPAPAPVAPPAEPAKPSEPSAPVTR